MNQRKEQTNCPTTNIEAQTYIDRIQTQYCGETRSGKIRLRRGSVTLYGIGRLYEVISTKLVDGKRKVKLNSTPKRTTTYDEKRAKRHSGIAGSCGSEPKSDQKRIACIGRTSGKEFRFIGTILRGKGHKLDQNKKIIPLSALGDIRVNFAEEKTKNLLKELQLISGARNTGFDPSLKLVQVCVLVQESRSSVYRKIACGTFPPQIKRGKGSFWLLSQIENYAAGKWEVNTKPEC